MTSKGKRLAQLTITLGVLVLLIAGYAFREEAAEQWNLWKLESDDEATRVTAAEKLGEMRSVKAVPMLMELLPKKVRGWVEGNQADANVAKVWPKDWRSWVEGNIGDALLAIGEPAVPALLKHLADDDVKFCAVLALSIMGPVAHEAAPALIEILTDKKNKRLQAVAAGALGNLLAEEAVPALRNSLRDEDRFVRLEAARALGRIGSPAKSAIPALVGALKDPEADVREAAAEALKKIQNDE